MSAVSGRIEMTSRTTLNRWPTTFIVEAESPPQGANGVGRE